MSELSTLTSHYAATADLAQLVNQAVIIMKKGYYRLPGFERITEAQLKESCTILVGFLGELLTRLVPDLVSPELERRYGIPGTILERVRERKRGEWTYFLEDLKAARDHLQKGIGSLTEGDLRLLDDLCGIIDAEVSSVFRKLWRK